MVEEAETGAVEAEITTTATARRLTRNLLHKRMRRLPSRVKVEDVLVTACRLTLPWCYRLSCEMVQLDRFLPMYGSVQHAYDNEHDDCL